MGKQINWREAAINGALTGLTLVEPRSLRTWQRWVYSAVLAGLTGAAAYEGIRMSLESDDESAVANLAVMATAGGIATAGVVFGLREPLLAADAWCVDQAKGLGIRHPRRWMALVSAASSVLSVALEAKVQPDEPEEELETDQAQDLEPRVRQVIAEMLAKIDEWGAVELRRQLPQAKQYGTHEIGCVGFEVPAGVPLAASAYYDFPVRGHGQVGEQEVTITLIISEGVLASLTCEDTEGMPMPLPDEVRYTVPATAR